MQSDASNEGGDKDAAFKINISVDGRVFNAAGLSAGTLREIGTDRQIFSSMDAMPAPSVILAEGISLKQLLSYTSINPDDIQSIKFSSSDGWSRSFTHDFLFKTDRYYYPKIVECFASDPEGKPDFKPEVEEGKKVIYPMLALKSSGQRLKPEPDWSKLSGREGIKFCFGQLKPEEGSMLNYGKYINQMTVVLKDSTPVLSLGLISGEKFKPGENIKINGNTQNLSSLNLSFLSPDGKYVFENKDVESKDGTFSLELNLKKDVEGEYLIKAGGQAKNGGFKAEYKVVASQTAGEEPGAAEEEPAPPPSGGSTSGVQGVPSDTLTIKVGYYGGPYEVKKVFKLDDLLKLPQVSQAYTYIDAMPAVVVDSANGVRLKDILKASGIDVNSVETFYFYCTDVTSTWYEALPKDFLLDTKRYYFPNLPKCWDSDTASASEAAVDGAVGVDTIIAYEDNWKRFGIQPDFSSMDTSTRFRLVFGQTDTSTMTASRSAKWIHAIEVMLGGTPPSGITINENMLNLEVGAKFQLKATVKGDGKADKRVKWSSSDPDIVRVDSTGKIKVLNKGPVKITASTVTGGKTAYCFVNDPDAVEKLKVGSEVGGTSENIPGDNPSGHITADPQGKSSPDKTIKPDNITGDNLKKPIKTNHIKEIKNRQADTESKESVRGSPEAGIQKWRVFEMSKDAVPLQAENMNLPFLKVAILFALFFMFGAGYKYLSYKNEV